MSTRPYEPLKELELASPDEPHVRLHLTKPKRAEEMDGGDYYQLTRQAAAVAAHWNAGSMQGMGDPRQVIEVMDFMSDWCREASHELFEYELSRLDPALWTNLAHPLRVKGLMTRHWLQQGIRRVYRMLYDPREMLQTPKSFFFLTVYLSLAWAAEKTEDLAVHGTWPDLIENKWVALFACLVDDLATWLLVRQIGRAHV